MKTLSFSDSAKQVLIEMSGVLEKVNEQEVERFVARISRAKKIVILGAGRMGIVSKSFAMRLKHFGLNAYCYGDSNVPNIGKGDLLIVCSGSGETRTILKLCEVAKEHNCPIFLISTKTSSSMAKLASDIVVIPAPSKTDDNFSIQPMTSLNEQSLWIFFDTIVLLLMKALKKTEKDLWKAHSILE
jgi:6-phospho-3-hexuloisomerase